MVPGWDNTVLGVQTGIWVALFVIFCIGMLVRSIGMWLFPHLIGRWTKYVEHLDDFEVHARSPFGAAMAGLFWWKSVEYLGQESALEGAVIILPSTYEYWLTAFGEVTFLVGLILTLVQLVQFVETVVLWWDKDGVLDGTEKTLITAVQSVMRFIILVFGSLAVAEAFDFDMAALLAGLGVGGLALAFAAKDTIGNIFGAVTLLLDRPFKMGDWIKVGAAEGEVFEIGIRTTQIRTSSDTVVTLPNAALVNKEIENFGKRRWRRYLPVFYLDLDSDPKAVEDFCHAIEQMIADNEKTMKESDSYALVNAISKDSIEVSCNLYWDIKSGLEEKRSREAFLVQVTYKAKELGLKFFEPRIRRSLE